MWLKFRMPAVIHNNSNTYYISFIPAVKIKIFKIYLMYCIVLFITCAFVCFINEKFNQNTWNK